MHYILLVNYAPNNIFFQLTDAAGNTIFVQTAKAAQYKSKQVRRTIVIEALWAIILKKLETEKIRLNISALLIKMKGKFFKKRDLINKLQKNFRIIGVFIESPLSFNGCKTKHLRRK